MKTLPAFVISLDLELMWGVRDHHDKTHYGEKILGGREAIPQILDLFAKYNVRATWATVGLAFCESKDEMLSVSPALRPSYQNSKFSNYSYFKEVGENEKNDPYYFGASLISLIASTPGQEIGSHTFSHYYCLESGQTVEQFDADIKAAVTIALQRNITLKSFVFPRNQFSEQHLTTLARHNITVYRGNEPSWPYQAIDGGSQSPIRRISRLADQYINLCGHQITTPTTSLKMTDVAASRFLRPYSIQMARLDNLRMRRMTASMTNAAQTDGIFHLWWHPHNFGMNVDENLTILSKILAHYSKLQGEYGMISACMGDYA